MAEESLLIDALPDGSCLLYDEAGDVILISNKDGQRNIYIVRNHQSLWGCHSRVEQWDEAAGRLNVLLPFDDKPRSLVSSKLF